MKQRALYQLGAKPGDLIQYAGDNFIFIREMFVFEDDIAADVLQYVVLCIEDFQVKEILGVSHTAMMIRAFKDCV